MPECAYMPCKTVFEIKPGAKGLPKKYCCRRHALDERNRLRRIKIRRTKICGYCEKSFITHDTRQIYCCHKCKKLEGRRVRATSQTPEQTAQKQRRKDAKLEAREWATLNCALHTACLRAFELPCLNCTKKIYKEDAWQHEPGVLVQNR